MIQPINQNLNINTANALKPVEVPHFCGLTKIEKVDSFAKKNKQTVPFKQKALNFFDSAKEGAKTGAGVVVDTAKKGAEFTKTFVQSLYKDGVDIAKARGKNTLTNIDSVV